MGEVENVEGASERIIKLKIEGLSPSAIADKINEEFKSDITAQQVSYFCNRNQNRMYQIMKGDKNFQDRLYKTYWNTVNQLTDINAEIVSLFYELRQNPELKEKSVRCPHCSKSFMIKIEHYSALLKSADLLLSQIKHVDEVLGKVSKKPMTITYNYVDLTKKLWVGGVIPNILRSLERSGDIKIKKKRLLQTETPKVEYESNPEYEEDSEISSD